MKDINKRELLTIKGFLVFMFFWYSAYLQYIPIYLFHLKSEATPGVVSVLLSTYSSVIVAIVLFILYRKDLKKEFRIFLKKPMDHLDNGFHYYGIGLIIMFISNFIITYFFRTGANNEEIVQQMISAFPLLMFLNACIIAPFNEEIVFRKTLKDVITSPAIFATLSFLLFGFAHVIGSADSVFDVLYIIPYGALGAAFAFAYSKTETIFTSMAIHIIHNTVLTLLSILLIA